MSDEQIERIRWALHYYGDTIPNDQDPLMSGLASLHSIEEELARLRETRIVDLPAFDPEYPEALKILAHQLTETRAEVERLRNVTWDCPNCGERITSLIRGSALPVARSAPQPIKEVSE